MLADFRKAIESLVKLVPRAVRRLGEHLEHHELSIRRTAAQYILWLAEERWKRYQANDDLQTKLNGLADLSRRVIAECNAKYLCCTCGKEFKPRIVGQLYCKGCEKLNLDMAAVRDFLGESE